MTTHALTISQYYIHQDEETGYFNVISKTADELDYTPQGKLNTHKPSDCVGDHPCAIHNNASMHALGWAPLLWDEALKTLYRVCEHGKLHPDYDSAKWLESRGDWHRNIHTCDGCCKYKSREDY
jgi:hypothetical protein